MSTSARATQHSITVVGGPTAVIDLAGLRIVIDPTFDAAGTDQGYLTKTEGPALSAEEVGPADLVLISHEAHPDNLDSSGRDYALSAGRLICGTAAAPLLGERATGLAPWQSTTVEAPDGAVVVTAVPAVHGPEDAERTAEGFVNCEVLGFVLAGEGLPTIYLSGDNASVRAVAQIADRFPTIDWAVINIGAARVATRFEGRALSMTSQRAAAAAQILAPAKVIPAHYTGWAHFSEGASPIRPAFEDAGVGGLLRLVEHGRPVILE